MAQQPSRGLWHPEVFQGSEAERLGTSTPTHPRGTAMGPSHSWNPTVDRVVWWVDAQFGYLTDPRRAAMLLASSEMATMPEGVELRAEVTAVHRELTRASLSILGA